VHFQMALPADGVGPDSALICIGVDTPTIQSGGDPLLLQGCLENQTCFILVPLEEVFGRQQMAVEHGTIFLMDFWGSIGSIYVSPSDHNVIYVGGVGANCKM
ncbi:MAG: hypothetical protein IPL55_07975, partial [Saprospiraceae bacterium]|nr:hypothetical protein [Saprospiraceae bacterium]